MKSGMLLFSIFLLICFDAQSEEQISWLPNKGYPYVLDGRRINKKSVFCYGEILSQGKSEMIVCASKGENCPDPQACFAQRHGHQFNSEGADEKKSLKRTETMTLNYKGSVYSAEFKLFEDLLYRQSFRVELTVNSSNLLTTHLAPAEFRYLRDLLFRELDSKAKQNNCQSKFVANYSIDGNQHCADLGEDDYAVIVSNAEVLKGVLKHKQTHSATLVQSLIERN